MSTKELENYLPYIGVGIASLFTLGMVLSYCKKEEKKLEEEKHEEEKEEK